MAGLALAVDAAIEAAPADTRDVGAQQLARILAQAIDDDPELLADLSPKLLATLAQLGLTPVARGTAKGGPDAPVASKLDELRERRRRRGGG